MYTTTFEVTPEELKESLGRPGDFGYFGDNEEMFETWSLGPVIESRDSKVLEKVNRAVLEKRLEGYEDYYTITGCSHWAVGWVDHLSFQACDERRQPTMVARIIFEWLDECREYCCLDAEALYLGECEETIKAIHQIARNFTIFEVPDTWEEEVFHWLEENEPNEVESLDFDGAWPSEEACQRALEALEYLDEEYVA